MFRWFARLCIRRPVRGTGAVATVVLAVQTAIDAAMGHGAEFFNAWHSLLALGGLVATGEIPALPFIAGQAALGPFALPVALGVLIGLPVLVAAIVVGVVRFFAVASRRCCTPV